MYKMPRSNSNAVSEMDIRLYCDGRLPESFDNVVACDGCDNWFHYRCVHVDFNTCHVGDWFCNHSQ